MSWGGKADGTLNMTKDQWRENREKEKTEGAKDKPDGMEGLLSSGLDPCHTHRLFQSKSYSDFSTVLGLLPPRMTSCNSD